MTESEMLALIAELASVKSQQNIAAALALYHPDIELVSPGFGSCCQGRDEVEKSLKLFFQLFPDYRVTLTGYQFNGSVLLSSGEVSLTPNIPGWPCRSVCVPVQIEFRFRDKHIHKEVFGLDPKLVCDVAGVPVSLWKAAISEFLSMHTVKE